MQIVTSASQQSTTKIFVFPSI